MSMEEPEECSEESEEEEESSQEEMTEEEIKQEEEKEYLEELSKKIAIILTSCIGGLFSVYLFGSYVHLKYVPMTLCPLRDQFSMLVLFFHGEHYYHSQNRTQSLRYLILQLIVTFFIDFF